MNKLHDQPAAVEDGIKIKMKDLARLLGISRSTIRHYLKIGLLHQPNREVRSHKMYNWTHLSRLMRIRQLRKEHKLPLWRIKEVLSDEGMPSPGGPEESEVIALIKAVEKEKIAEKSLITHRKKQEILDAAIALFSKKGYEKTTVEDIADALEMGKATVYLFFESKENLFLECFERLGRMIVPEEAWEGIRKERDFWRRNQMRLTAFLKAFHSYRGVLNMARATLGGENPNLAKKAGETLALIARPIAKDLRWGIADGTLRVVDEELVSHLMVAMGEGLGSILMMDSRYTLEEVVKTFLDLWAHAIGKNESDQAPRCKQSPFSGEVDDRKGTKTRVSGIQFGNEIFFAGHIGDAYVQVDLENVVLIQFVLNDGELLAEITLKDGSAVTMQVDSVLTLSGEARYGMFSIELENIDRILFHNSNRVDEPDS